MTSIASVILEASDPAGAERFYKAAFDLGDRLQVRPADAPTRQTPLSESLYSACRRLQPGVEEATRIHQLFDELLPVLLRHGRPRNLPVARSRGCKRIFDRNPSK